MYPAGELNLLAARKALLFARIAERRQQCVEAGTELARPLTLVERGLALWRSVPPIAKAVAAPLLLMVIRKFSGRAGWIGTIARFAPMVFGMGRTEQTET